MLRFLGSRDFLNLDVAILFHLSHLGGYRVDSTDNSKLVSAGNTLVRLVMKNTANYGERGELRNVVIHMAVECVSCLCLQLRHTYVSLNIPSTTRKFS